MNWDAVGAIAELLGAIGVIATLAYLTVQIRQNTSALESNSESDAALEFAAWHGRVADNEALWGRGR